jgi:hypothetical protein
MWGFWGRGKAASSRVCGIGGGNDYPLGHHRGSEGDPHRDEGAGGGL